jgi:hypothetical protein
MSNKSPFSQLFQIFGRVPEKHVDSINQQPFEKMLALLKSPLETPGIGILLRAPRAGYGKTHLLSRLGHELSSSHEFILIQPTDGFRVDASAVLMDVLAKLTRTLPAGGGLTMLDMASRRILALALEPLVRSGEVPCQDRDMALNALRLRPTETFDFHLPIAVTAHWARDNFEILGPRLALEIGQIIGAPLREVSFWIDVMFRYSVTPVDQPGRSGLLMSAVADAAATNMMDRLTTLLKLLSQLSRVVLVADELEGMSANEEAALRLAAFVTALRHGAERVDFIISVNDDVWENAFIPRLSGGLLDRLSESVVRLSPLTPEQVKELLESRDSTTSQEIADQILSANTEMYSRGILRAAADVWQYIPVPVEDSPFKKVVTEVFYEEPQISVDEVIAPLEDTPLEQTTESDTVFTSADPISAPIDEMPSLATAATPWQASHRSVVAVEPEDSVVIPEKPVFVPPPMLEPIFPQTNDIFPDAAPTASPFETMATKPQTSPAPNNAWWAESQKAAVSSIDSRETVTADFATDSFNEPESPFITSANTEEYQDAPVNVFFTEPFTPVFSIVEERNQEEQVEFTPEVETIHYDNYTYHDVTAATPSVEEQESTITEPATQDEPWTNSYGAVAAAFAEDQSAANDQQKQPPVDRVDELLRQFRERYGRS